MAVVILGDSLTFHGPLRAEPMDDPRLWPNLLAAGLDREVQVFARQGWTARDCWWALTKDPRVWALVPDADAVLLAVGSMDQLPVALPTYLRMGISHLSSPVLREAARQGYARVNPALVRLVGGPLRTLPQRLTDEYLTRCVEALRVLRPELPVAGVVPPAWLSPYYPSVRRHPPAVAAARAWGERMSVPMADWERAVAPHVPAGLNPDGMHWGWACHEDVARLTADLLAPLLDPAGG